MRRIMPSELARMLNEGFEGKVKFTGSVFISLREERESKSLDDRSPTFYLGGGKFSIKSAGRENGVEDCSYALVNSRSTFYFKPAEGEIESTPAYRDSEVIPFDIDFPLRGRMQIEPRDIVF